MKNVHKYQSHFSIIDFQNYFLTTIAFFFFITVVNMHPKTSSGAELKAEFIITADWDKAHDVDIDLWVENPNGDIAYFKQRDAGMMSLDHDSQGSKTDEVKLENGQEVSTSTYNETTAIRALMPGEYTVNLVVYSAKGLDFGGVVDTPVRVQLTKINPSVRIAYNQETLMKYVKEEKTVLRFTVDSKGNISKIDTTTPKSLMGR